MSSPCVLPPAQLSAKGRPCCARYPSALQESDEGEESDWAPPGHRTAAGRAGRQPSSAAAAAAAGEGVGEEEEEEESESDLEPEGEGSSGKKAARGGAGEGGGPRRRGGRIKQGVAVEAPEIGSTFR